jgi:hypothetical protein
MELPVNPDIITFSYSFKDVYYDLAQIDLIR